MNGVNASSVTPTGRRRSRKVTWASGNSPVNRADSSLCRPGALREPRPNGPWYGGWSRASSTLTNGGRAPRSTRMEGNAYPGALPRSGRLKICQSRSCPRPPSPIEPAPTPPSGKEICDNRGPVKTRGYVTRGGDAPGCAEAGRAVGAGAAGGETCPAPSAAPTGMAAAAAALSDCLRKSRRPCAAGTFFDGMVAEYRRFSVRKAGGGT